MILQWSLCVCVYAFVHSCPNLSIYLYTVPVPSLVSYEHVLHFYDQPDKMTIHCHAVYYKLPKERKIFIL